VLSAAAVQQCRAPCGERVRVGSAQQQRDVAAHDLKRRLALAREPRDRPHATVEPELSLLLLLADHENTLVVLAETVGDASGAHPSVVEQLARPWAHLLDDNVHGREPHLGTRTSTRGASKARVLHFKPAFKPKTGYFVETS